MAYDALPCFACSKQLRNCFGDSEENQPREGTEFRTYGHYGSSFWDSFDGEELVLNICDECLRAGTRRLAQHKRFQPVICEQTLNVGRQWVDRPMLPWTGHADRSTLNVEAEELGEDLAGVEWASGIEELREHALRLAANPEDIR